MARKGTSLPKSRIEHSVYGLGTIVDVNNHYTTISFDDAGTRKFLTRLVEFSPSDVPCPPKPRRKKSAGPSTSV